MLGKKIKQYRLMKRLTMKELAKKLDVGQSTISMWENGKREPSHETLKEIARVLGVKVTDFFEEDENEFTEEEEAFLKDVDLTDDELIEKYNLVIDGKKASKEEIEAAIQMIRTLRKALNKAR